MISPGKELSATQTQSTRTPDAAKVPDIDLASAIFCTQISTRVNAGENAAVQGISLGLQGIDDVAFLWYTNRFEVPHPRGTHRRRRTFAPHAGDQTSSVKSRPVSMCEIDSDTGPSSRAIGRNFGRLPKAISTTTSCPSWHAPTFILQSAT